MTEEELFQEFLEASKIDKDDVAYYGRFIKFSNGNKTYEGIEGLYVELKKSDPLALIPPILTYFHPTTTARLNND